MIVNIAVCDDEQQSLDTIHNELMKAGANLNISIETYLYTNGNKVVDLICSGKEDFNVLFLDIDMPNISGLDVARKIRAAKSDILLIFISAHEQYVFESIEYNPYRYIRKNKMNQEIQPALKAAYKHILSEVQKSIIVKTEDGEVRLKHSEIVYFDIEARKVKIYMCDRREFVTRKTIKELYSELENEDFVQIHSGCVVNARYIDQYSSFDITLDDGKRLIVSRRRMKDVKTKILNYWRDRV